MSKLIWSVSLESPLIFQNGYTFSFMVKYVNGITRTIQMNPRLVYGLVYCTGWVAPYYIGYSPAQ